MMRVGITGGIGSGKSTVCRMLEQLGAAIYDSDANAKRLMNESGKLRRQLIAEFGDGVFGPEGLNRSYLASVAFTQPEKLHRLNEIVHPAVRHDFRRWCEEQTDKPYVVFESAILFEAGFENEVDKTLAVVAPRELRIEWACKRDGADREAVERRIAQQLSDDELQSRADYTIANIRLDYLRNDVGQLDKIFRYEAHRLASRT